MDRINILKSAANNLKSGIIIRWHDSKPTGAIGWLCIDRIINGIAGGGIFMHANATEQETYDIAQNMSKKFTVTDPQIGGAKAGIRFDHTDSRAKSVLRRFIIDMEPYLKTIWVTAGDLNTDDIFIEKVIKEDIGLATCQATLGKIIAETTNKKDLSNQLAKYLTFPANDYFPLIEGAVGYGLAHCIKQAWEYTGAQYKPRIIIQGFGAVGSSTAYYIQEYDIGTIVAIADEFGYIHNAQGIDVKYYLTERKKFGSEYMKVIPQLESTTTPYKPREKGTNDEEFFKIFLNCEDFDILVPCAKRYQITKQIVEFLLNNRWNDMFICNHKWIISGANNPFGVYDHTNNLVEDKEGSVESLCRDNNICILPDWVANSGTAQLFHRLLSVGKFQFNMII